jgi:hypothetical protein
MRAGSQEIFGEVKRCDCPVALHSRKVVEELIQRIPGSQVVEEILYWHAGASEDWRASEDLGVDLCTTESSALVLAIIPFKFEQRRGSWPWARGDVRTRVTRDRPSGR